MQVYRARNPKKSPLWQIANRHYDEFPCGLVISFIMWRTLYAGKPAVRNEPRGWRNRGHDLMAICHDARKGRYSGSHWSKPARLRSTRPVCNTGRAVGVQ